MSALRVIAHLDMDAFYASVELLRYPELRGRPVVIGGGRAHQPQWETDPGSGERRRRFATLRGYAGRGVITTATYEARALGVNSAMGMMKAAAKAPDAVLLPVDFDEYRKYSRLFKAAVRALAPQVEDRGIDEIYIDLTEVVAARLPTDEESDPDDAERNVWWCAREVAAELKQAVKEATGLSCSVGLAPNKLIAKIASELDKPDGLTVVTERDVATRLAPLSVRRLNGVGPKSAAKLARLGIATIGELAQADRAWLVQQFGVRRLETGVPAHHIDQIRDHRGRGGERTGTCPVIECRAYGIALDQHRVHHAIDIGDQPALRDQGRMHPELDPVFAAPCYP